MMDRDNSRIEGDERKPMTDETRRTAILKMAKYAAPVLLVALASEKAMATSAAGVPTLPPIFED